MSLNESIDALVTDTVTVKRRAEGTWTDGIYTPGTLTTFSANVVMQPAFGLNRIIGGADLHSEMDNQSAPDVRVLYTTTKFYTRSPSTDPDVIVFESADWTTIRVEEWNLSGEKHYRVIITKVTHGAS